MRLLPQEMTDPIREDLIQGILDGAISWEEAAIFFMQPHVGFHHSAFLLTLHTAEYRRFGHHSVCVPKGMQKALGKTTLAEVRPIDFKPAYGSVYIALPDCEYQLWGGMRTGWHDVGGVYARYVEGGVMTTMDLENGTLQRAQGDTNNAVLQIYMWGMENARSATAGDDASFWLTVDLKEVAEAGHDLELYVEGLLTDPTRDGSMDGLTELGKKIHH